MTPTPSDMPHRALRAVRDHTDAEQAAIDTSIAEVEYILEHWFHDYGVEDLGHAITLTEITLHNIIVQEDQ